MRAIISVSNKSGIADFAQGLQELDIEVFSTGGTKKSLEADGIKARSISELTGFPEILAGRVKTCTLQSMVAFWQGVICLSIWMSWHATILRLSTWLW